MSNFEDLRKRLGDAYTVEQLGVTGLIFIVTAPFNTDSTVDAPTEDGAERTRLEAMGIRALKAEAKERNFDPADLKGISKENLVETLLNDINEASEDDADEEDEEEDEDGDSSTEEGDDEEGDGYSESELNDMSLAEVNTVCEEAGWTRADLKGKDKDALIAEYGEYIGFAGDEEEGDSDDSDEDEESEDEEADALDEDALNAMTLAEVKQIAKDYGVKVTKGASQKDIVAAILDQAGEDEENEDGDGDGDEDEPPF